MKIHAKSVLLSSIGLISTLTVANPIQDQRRWAVGQIVHTTSGSLTGRAASNATGVSEYLGIPYAVPPTGNLRFQPPVKYVSSSMRNATSFGPACMQPPVLGSTGLPPGLPATAASSEDCLSLNVWTKPQVGERKKAVLVWVHGGAYTSGSSKTPAFNGQYIVDQTDVIVVSLNYRLNIFGFPGNPDTTANPGLLDVRMAMKWIRDNISKFGGDASRITMWGQSAGAGMVDFYSYAYATDSIANGFILMSATVNGFPARDTLAANANWNRIATSAGCAASNTTSSAAITACMRSKSATDIISTLGATSTWDVVVDDQSVFANYTGRKNARGGYLIGNTQNEAGLFRLFQNNTEAYWENFNDQLYTCGDADRIAQASEQGNPVWRYRYFGDFPNLVLSVNPPSGAFHTSDLPILFNTSPETVVKNTPAEIATGRYMRGAWAAFAKDPKRGLLRYEGGWPKYEAKTKSLNRFAFGNGTGMNLAVGNTYDDMCL